MEQFLNTNGFVDAGSDDVFDDFDHLSNVQELASWDFRVDDKLSCDFDVCTEIEGDSDSVPPVSNRSDLGYSVQYTRNTARNRDGVVSDGLGRNMSKNAILARENREKKKRYVCGLEKTVRDLSVKNQKLQDNCASLHKTVADLRREVNYLRGVIENQSALSRLLKHIPVAGPSCQRQVNASGTMSNDALQKRNPTKCNDQLMPSSNLLSVESVDLQLLPNASCHSLLTEHDYAQSDKQFDEMNSSCHQFGVCLHVSNHTTSMQLCELCNENAQ